MFILCRLSEAVNAPLRVESNLALAEYSGKLEGEKAAEKADARRRRVEELDGCLNGLAKAEAEGLRRVEGIRRDKQDWYERSRLEKELMEGRRGTNYGRDSFGFYYDWYAKDEQRRRWKKDCRERRLLELVQEVIRAVRTEREKVDPMAVERGDKEESEREIPEVDKLEGMASSEQSVNKVKVSRKVCSPVDIEG